MSDRKGPWTLLLLSSRGTETRSLTLSRSSLALAVAVGILVLAGTGFALGIWWSDRTEASRMAELEAEVAELTAERARVVELAERLEEVESEYGRIVRALGGTPARASRDPALALPGAESRSAAAAADASPLRPTAWPLSERGFVTRSFGAGADPAGHPGLDIAVPLGSYVRAAGGGVVFQAGTDSVYGRYVRIAHGDGLSSLYAHNSWLFVAAGDSVEKREVIALSGSTGRSTAPHLHFEIQRQGELVDPLRYVSLGR